MHEFKQLTVDQLTGDPAIVDLFHSHWEEIALNKQLMKLKPLLDKYYQLESNGMLLVIGAYADGELVGYSVNFLTQHLHYSELWTCMNDIVFIRQDMRKSGIGAGLMQHTEELAKERGAQMMLWHAKENTTLAALLPRIGYGVQDIVFSKGL